MNPDVINQEKKEEYVKLLKSMVPGHEFEGFSILEHSANCPDETVDLFNHESSLRYSDMQDMFLEQMDNMEDDY